MSKSRYSYAPDEFDTPVPQGAPVGVHRTQRSGWSKTWPFLVVAVVFAGLAFGGFKYFFDKDPAAPPTAASTSSAPADDTVVDDGTNEDPGAEDPGAEEPSPEEPTPEEPTPAADVNFAASVRVLNGAGVNQLAAAGAEVLTSAGFTSVQPDTYTGPALPVSTVYYQSADLEATAHDIATRFGIPVDADHIKLEPGIQAQVSVVFMEDFRS